MVGFEMDTWRGLFEFYRLAKLKWKQQRIEVKPRVNTQFQLDVGNSRNENHDAPSENWLNTSDNDASWSDLNPVVLLLVMMQLGVYDFVAFSGVCKSWRSLALSNKCKFLASRSPMFVRISTYLCDKKSYCYLEDLEGRKFKTSVPYCANPAGSIPYTADMDCIGSTCGYLILYGKGNKNFWFLNPITRHTLSFPHFPKFFFWPNVLGAILVFSRSMSRWVFVMINGYTPTDIHFSIAGQGTWKCVSSPFPIIDLEAFKGRIYTMNNSCHLCELIFNPEPKLMLLETKNFPIFSRSQKLVSSCKNLYLREYLSEYSYKVHRLDFDDMNWVSCEEESEECSFIHSTLKQRVPLKHPKGKLFTSWYIPMIV